LSQAFGSHGDRAYAVCAADAAGFLDGLLREAVSSVGDMEDHVGKALQRRARASQRTVTVIASEGFTSKVTTSM
jgi:hypothetical protein